MNQKAFVAFVAFLALSRPALAHGEVKSIGYFYTGLLHPFLTATHVLTVAAAGLLLARLGTAHILKGYAAFLAMFLLALVVTVLGVRNAGSTNAILAFAALAGAIVATNSHAGPRVILPIAAMMGLLLGLDSAGDSNFFVSNLLLATGTFLSVGYIVAVIALIAPADRALGWQKIGVRILGSWITAASMLVLALAFAPRSF